MFDDSKDDFWDLEKDIHKKNNSFLTPRRTFKSSSTSAVDIEVTKVKTAKSDRVFSDSSLTSKKNDSITHFIPPHKSQSTVKKYILKEYISQKPFINTVRLCSDKENDTVFIENNLFLRERRALLHRTVESEPPYASYFSYSPRYSQLTRSQLNYYIWWRQNIKNGIFLTADTSYVVLFAYETAACGENEDKQQALDMLCRVFVNCCGNDTSLKMILRDIICDFSLIYDLTVSMEDFSDSDRRFFFGSSFNLPEAFIDFSEDNITSLCYATSMYDYRRSKIYSNTTASLFNKAIGGAMRAVFGDEKAFEFLTSFKKGMYNCITLEHRPLSRMVNIVNRHVKLEIEYYQMNAIQDIITNAVRYAENKLRDHLGVKNKLNILYINPAVKEAIDRFFDENYPPMPVIDRRRKAEQKENAEQSHEYDKLYDLPRVEFSAERALKIEEESWETTRILNAAFDGETEQYADDISYKTVDEQNMFEEAVSKEDNKADVDVSSVDASAHEQTYRSQFFNAIGDIAEFIDICKSHDNAEKRKFAGRHGRSVDEIADLINEAALEILGDIVLEDSDNGYLIIEDYQDLF